jgi:hypothetical protein
VFQRAAEPAQELDLAVPTFEPDQFLFLVPKPVSHLLAWRAERVAGRSMRIGVPVSFLVWSIGTGGLLDGDGDRAAGMAGDSQANSDLGVEPRRIRSSSCCCIAGGNDSRTTRARMTHFSALT